MFIVIEGADNRGKSTVVKELHYQLLRRDKTVMTFISPNRNTVAGKKIDKLLKGKERPDAIILQALMTASRIEELPELKKSFKEYDVVIYDRYDASTVVYGHFDGLPLEFSDKLAAVLPDPDYTFVLYGNNYNLKGDGECYDDHGKKIEDLYIKFAPRYKWILIDNNSTPEGIVKKILEIIGIS